MAAEVASCLDPGARMLLLVETRAKKGIPLSLLHKGQDKDPYLYLNRASKGSLSIFQYGQRRIPIYTSIGPRKSPYISSNLAKTRIPMKLHRVLEAMVTNT